MPISRIALRYTHLKLVQSETTPSSVGPEGTQLPPLLPQQKGAGGGSFDPRITGKSVYTIGGGGLSVRPRKDGYGSGSDASPLSRSDSASQFSLLQQRGAPLRQEEKGEA